MNYEFTLVLKLMFGFPQGSNYELITQRDTEKAQRDTELRVKELMVKRENKGAVQKVFYRKGAKSLRKVRKE
jgi:hypothetical protein